MILLDVLHFLHSVDVDGPIHNNLPFFFHLHRSKPFRVIRALFSTLLLVAMIIIIPLLLLFFCSIAFEPDSELIALVVFALIPLFLGVLVLHGIFYCIYAHT